MTKRELAQELQTIAGYTIRDHERKIIEEAAYELRACADEEELTARWVDTKYTQWPANEIRSCSACGWSIHKNHLRHKDLAWKFCPVCGAKMRTEKRNEI